jgi:hypothetical protein
MSANANAQHGNCPQHDGTSAAEMHVRFDDPWQDTWMSPPA